MRYHRRLQDEVEEVAGVFYDLPSVARSSLYNGMRGELIATDANAVLSSPVPVRVLGSVSHQEYWQEIQLRDTIARSWGRQDEQGVIEIGVGGRDG